ncbi:hypothetical protein BGW36DRAFT_386813 [Talaromyces proteolyticus]|uniref:Uncharacterized protein n=1 Tax=Talaromyces proteolyticus TaxID=1131652 RepID=A0AAD4KHP7_9EURO|nr:uncharacterized protein BGW36DRAFT_386813 [Talaromyces proteolyticus]KAH8692010.1 hypothetical protein BGW36DRAFT_386813 [Talaromyces proteolyticus]
MHTPLSLIVKKLATTPPEIVCEILQDLRFWDVLRLIAHDNPSVNYSVMSHPWYGKVFKQSMDLLAPMKETTRTYWDFGREMRWKLAPLDSPLALSAGFESQAHRSRPDLYPLFTQQHDNYWHDADIGHQYTVIINYMKLRIANYLNSLDGLQFKLLPYYSNEPHALLVERLDLDIDGLKRRWIEYKRAQSNLMTQRARQLTRAADLLEANPDILKLASDPSQQRRKSLGHIIQNMRGIAQKMLQGSMIRGDANCGRCYFFVYFPVVPFDACLRIVLKNIKAHRKNGSSGVYSEGSSQDENEKKGPIEVFLAGLSSIYTGRHKWLWTIHDAPVKKMQYTEFTNPERIPRVMDGDNPYDPQQDPCTSELNYEQLKFVSGYTKFYRFLLSQKTVALRDNIQMAWDKHDDRELEWLEAFVKVYRLVQASQPATANT